MNESGLLKLHTDIVHPEWIDYNGHMNLAFFVMAFDFATDEFFDYIGMDEAYRVSSGCSLYLLETHVTYVSQMLEGERMRFETQLLDYDHKRVHMFHFMYHQDENTLAATTELMFVHVDTTEDHSSPMPGDMCDRLEQVLQSHQQLPRPEHAGSVIGMRRPQPAG